MKQRAAGAAAAPQTQCSTEGMTFFQIAGFVQDVATNDKMQCDYLRFNIKCKNKPEYFDIISVCMPHAIGVICEIGDCVVVRGYVRAWQRNGGITLELVAESVQPIDEKQLAGGRIK
jgi:hypothetical protein